MAVILLACSVYGFIPETPEVAAARAAHMAAHAAARSGWTYIPQQQPAVWNGFVLDTPEVYQEKVNFYRAYADAAAANGVVATLPALAPPALVYTAPQGQYLADTPEVVAAKQEFFRAYAAAAALAAQQPE